MQYVSGPRETSFTWFVAPETTDKQLLRRALQSVPGGAWAFVNGRLDAVLDEADTTVKRMAVKRGRTPSVLVVPLLDLELKLGLLTEEAALRRRPPTSHPVGSC